MTASSHAEPEQGPRAVRHVERLGRHSSFDAMSWASAAKRDMSWNSMSWTDQSWSDQSWSDQAWQAMSWTDMSWSSMSWTDMTWTDMSWADMSQEDAAEGDASGEHATGDHRPTPPISTAAATDPDTAVSGRRRLDPVAALGVTVTPSTDRGRRSVAARTSSGRPARRSSPRRTDRSARGPAPAGPRCVSSPVRGISGEAGRSPRMGDETLTRCGRNFRVSGALRPARRRGRRGSLR